MSELKPLRIIRRFPRYQWGYRWDHWQQRYNPVLGEQWVTQIRTRKA